MDIRAQFTVAAGVTGQAQVDKLHHSVSGIGKAAQVSAGQTAAAFRTLPAQFTDIATQLAGGQNPLLILLQQGGQIKDSFGGIGPAIRAIGSVLTPLRLAVGGVGTAIAALGFAAVSVQREIDALNKSLALTGNFAATSAGQVDEAVRRIRDTTKATAGNARDLLTGAIGSGVFSPATLEPVVQAMARLQKLSGATSEEILKDFSSMSKGVASWAAEHNRQYHYLNASQFAYIQMLERMGRTEDAMRENLKLLDKSLADRRVELGYLETAWLKIKDAASGAWDAMKAFGRPDTNQDKIKTLQEQLATLERLAKLPGTDRNAYLRKQADLLQQITDLEQATGGQQAAAVRASAAAAREQQKIDELNSGVTQGKAQAAEQLRLVQAQNASATRLGLLEQEQARTEAMKKTGLLSDEDYTRRRREIEREMFAEKIRLAAEEVRLEEQRSVRDQVDAANRRTRVEQLRGALDRVMSDAKVSEFLGDAPAANVFGDAIKSLNSELAKLEFQNEHVKTFGDRIGSAREAQMQFDVEQGKFARLTDEQKTRLLDAARSLDQYANSLQRALAGIDYDNQTKKIEANTASLGESTLQRQIAIELQDLENRGIKEGTALYQQLSQRRIDALKAANDAQYDWQLGVRQGFNDYAEIVANKSQAARDAIVNTFRTAEDVLTQFVSTGKFSFSDFARSVIADMARIYVRQQWITPLMKTISAWIPGAGGPQAYLPGANPLTVPVAANGMAFAGNVRAFARGDVIGGPSVFRFADGGAMRTGLMGEAGPEAIMPLKRGRDGRLGVAAQGGGGNITINVAVDVETGQTQVSGDNAGQLGTLVGQAVRQEIMDQMRPGGLLARAA